jgi:large repetitive protein
MTGILATQQINPSLAANNPNDVRYGEGQYFSDIQPGTMTSSQLSRVFLGMPFQGQKFTNYVEVNVEGLPVVPGRPNVYVVPNTMPLNIAGRVVGFGAN